MTKKRDYEFSERPNRRYWCVSRGLSKGQVQVLDALLLAPCKKAVAKKLDLSQHTVADQIKIMLSRYELHSTADLLMWWALWLSKYATPENRTKPMMPKNMWPFNMRNLP